MHSNPVGNVPTLTAADAAALVTLRMLLEEAVQRSADGTPTGRRICIILLDGACEASIALGLGNFNDAPGEKDSLQDIYSRLVSRLKAAGSLAPNGGITGWPDIKRLRRVRNDAQHHQIPPDHATLVGWSASVQRFVESVINHALGVQLSLVVLADSICDPELRQAFGSAEQLLIAGDYASTVRELKDVFRSARKKWDAEHRDATRLHRQSLPLRTRSNSDVEKVVESKINLMDDLLSVAPFVLDIGEYVWWQSLANSLRTTSAVPVTAQDARRAAAFVLSWIQRWEAFSSTYTHERLGIPKAAEVAESPLPGGDPILLPDQVDVSISRRASAREQTEDDLVRRISIGYAAGHRDDPGGNIWIHFLTKAFTQRGAERPPPPWESVGVIPGTLILTAATDVDPATVISAVNDVLKAAVALRAESTQDAEQRAVLAQQNADVLSDLKSALEQVTTADGANAFVQFRSSKKGSSTVLTATFCRPLMEAIRWRSQRMGAIENSPLTAGSGAVTSAGFELPLDTAVGTAVDSGKVAVQMMEAIRAEGEADGIRLAKLQDELKAKLGRAIEQQVASL